MIQVFRPARKLLKRPVSGYHGDCNCWRVGQITDNLEDRKVWIEELDQYTNMSGLMITCEAVGKIMHGVFL